MSSNQLRLLLGVGVLTALMTGCGHQIGSKPSSRAHLHVPAVVGDSSEKEGKAAPPRQGGFGYYAFKYRGTRGTALIPALPRDDARIAEIDSYRKRAGIGPIGYTVVDIDNTHGASTVHPISDVTVIPIKGANWEADTGPDEVLHDWKAPQEVVDKYPPGASVDGVAVGRRASFVLLAEFPLNHEPRKVLISLGDIHVVQATLVKATHPPAEGGLAQTGK